MADGMSEEGSPDVPRQVEPQLPSMVTDDRSLGVQSASRSSEDIIAAERLSAGEEIVLEWKAGRLRKRE